MAFATLDTRLRNEGAAMFTLIRNVGSAVGISVLNAMTIRNAATVHARLAEGIRPDNPALARYMPGFDFDVPVQVARLNAAITGQASMVSYIDTFWALFIVSLLVMPVILLMRAPGRASAEPISMHMD